MSSLNFLDKRILERLFGMGSGYVLNFSDRTFAEFVADVVGKDIDDERYRIGSGSKANRLRGFWKEEDDSTVARLLRGLAEYGVRFSNVSKDDPDLADCLRIAQRLEVAPSAGLSVPAASQGMFNLFVSADPESWDGRPFILERDRCFEYTDEEVRNRLGKLDQGAVDQVLKLPTVFASEHHHGIAPMFGRLTAIVPRASNVRFEYETWVSGWLSAAELRTRASEFGIIDFELHRHHWAIKEINLLDRLNRIGVRLPARRPTAVDLTSHQFDVALSFAGETRPYVEAVARALEMELGPGRCFYDNDHKAQLARPSVDELLVDIYRNRSRLVVAFIGGDYERKNWCGLEFRVVREIIFKREHHRVMYVRMDDEPVEGVLATDGYVDARTHSPDQVAEMIHQRVEALR